MHPTDPLRLKVGDRVTAKTAKSLGYLEIISIYSNTGLTARALLTGKNAVYSCENIEDLVLLDRVKNKNPRPQSTAEHRQYQKDLLKSD